MKAGKKQCCLNEKDQNQLHRENRRALCSAVDTTVLKTPAFTTTRKHFKIKFCRHVARKPLETSTGGKKRACILKNPSAIAKSLHNIKIKFACIVFTAKLKSRAFACGKLPFLRPQRNCFCVCLYKYFGKTI